MFAFIAALAQAGGIIIDKVALTRRRIEIRVFVPVIFLFLMLIAALPAPFLGRISVKVFEPKYIIVFALMVVVAVVWNFFYYKGVQKEKVQEFEMILMFQPLVTILLAAAFIERSVNIHILIASIVASLALVASHLKKMHFVLNRTSYGLIIAVIFMSIEIILQKVLLEVYSPVALYFIRTIFVFIFFYLYYRPHLKQVGNTNTYYIFLTAFLGVTQMITKLYGFERMGVIYTSLIMILAPAIVYVLSTVLLHERLKARTIVSVLVILACIVYATLLG